MRAPKRPVVERAVFVVAVALAGLFPLVALLRIGHPFELEWIEGGSLAMTGRVLQGLPLYVAPSLTYVPFNYPPLFFWVAAAFARVLGLGFPALRLVSLLAALAAGGAIARWTWLETRRRDAALLATCLFFATFRFAGAWLDVARSDSLQLALTLWTCALLRGRGRIVAPLVAGVLTALAFQAKQTAIVAALPVAGWLLVRERVRGAIFAATLAVALGLSIVALDAASGGWYRYYVFELAGRYSVEPTLVARFWTRDLLMPFGVAALGGLFAAVTDRGTAHPGRGTTWVAIAGLVLAAWTVRAFPAAYDNVLLPACAAAALLFGIGWDAATRAIAGAEPRRAAGLRAFVCAAALLQLVPFVYDPRAQIPRALDRHQGERFVDGLRAAPGTVLLPCHDYLAARTGKAGHFHEMAFMAVAKSGTDSTASRLLAQWREALAARHWSTIVLDRGDWLWDEVSRDYEPRFAVFGSDSVMWTMTGMHRRPEVIFVPKAGAP